MSSNNSSIVGSHWVSIYRKKHPCFFFFRVHLSCESSPFKDDNEKRKFFKVHCIKKLIRITVLFYISWEKHICKLPFPSGRLCVNEATPDLWEQTAKLPVNRLPLELAAEGMANCHFGILYSSSDKRFGEEQFTSHLFTVSVCDLSVIFAKKINDDHNIRIAPFSLVFLP